MRFINRLIPFLIAGMLITVMAFGMVLLAYLFLIGAVAGAVLFIISWIRERFFQPRQKKPQQQPSGRIIDSDEWRKL